MSNPNDFPNQHGVTHQPLDEGENGAWHFVPDPDYDFDEMFPPDTRTPEEIAAAQLADIYAHFYANGIETISELDAKSFSGVSQKGMDAWYTGLNQEDRKQLEEEKQALQENLRKAASVREQLVATVPELLDGHLPETQAGLVAERYILGTNQSGCFASDEAQDYLSTHHGVEVTMYNLNNRFLFFSDREAEATVRERALTTGYYGPSGGGRFVVVVPFGNDSWENYSQEDIGSVPDLAYAERVLPEDYEVHYGDNRNSVNAKYCAGFIDEAGIYHPNANFMKSAEPAMADPTSEIM